jgi:DNA-binding transcriptional ArsR family regulator
MAPPKNDQFSKEDIKLARFAKALSHPARVAILRHLASLETCCFNEISKELPLADSTVSQHMAELKNAGLIQGNFDPPKVRYCINYENWKIARRSLKEFVKIKVAKNEKEK